ncbi:nuclear transport factor 2 family protein [Curtobacterium flaccumfaciens]|uniref:nuclear transport factor 2 family protein n=1 Tax=Curtobacterium flaccumfaciens TaxID=2035 RepID=UPI0010614000|nr:nuclear transport factor 2 family protein [Curtobacterium flaccumfaciens]
MNDNNASPKAPSSSLARTSLDQWLVMWNRDGALAHNICSTDFRIRFAVTEPDGSTPADEIRTAEDFARYLEWWRGQHPGAVFTSIASAIDGDHGRLIWDMEAGDVHVGGVDVFDFDEDGRVRRVWSAGGQRSMRS